MAMNNQIISKGIYNRAQTAGYVSVKQFIFIRIGERKHLLLRFSNDLDTFITGMKYTVVQISADGEMIGRSHLTYKGRINAGESFSVDQALLVDENCVDVKVSIDSATSGVYEYSDRGGIVTVRYNDKLATKRIVKAEDLIAEANKKTLKKEKRRGRRMATMAILALLTIILINLFTFFRPLIEEEIEYYRRMREYEKNKNSYKYSETPIYDNFYGVE